jgi:hypothetical protein
MKKVKLVFTGMFFFLLAIGVNAQVKTSGEYFVGKWSLLVVGTPEGDAKMVVSLGRIDGKLAGTIAKADLSDPKKFTSITESENSITVNWTSGDYDVFMELTKKGDNHIEGTLMNMFDAKGDRIIATK